MKPGDHPDFFRLPPPPGRSRESTIHLDAAGRFWHGGELVHHPGMQRAFASWVARHPDDGRFILSNGYDWSYFQVEDAPLFVEGVRLAPPADPELHAGATLLLFDGSEEPLEPRFLWTGEGDALHTWVRRRGLTARFQRAAQLSLAPLLAEDERGRVELALAGERYPIGDSPPSPPW